MLKQIIVTSLIGVAAASIGFVIGKKKGYEEGIKECMSIKDYEEHQNKYARKSDPEEEPDDEDVTEESEPEEVVEEPSDSKEAMDYTQYFYEDELADDDEEEEDTPEDLANLYFEEHKNDPPMVITLDAIDAFPKYFEREMLLYYAYDEQLTSEDNEIITEEEKEELVESRIEDSGFIDNDEEMLCVVNFQMEKIYLIDKILASYNEEFFAPQE